MLAARSQLAARSLSRLAARLVRSLRWAPSGHDASSFDCAEPPGAPSAVRAAPPDANAAAPYLRSGSASLPVR